MGYSVENVELFGELESLSDVSWHFSLSSVAFSSPEAHLLVERKSR